MDLIEYPSIKHFKETTGNIYKYGKSTGSEKPIDFLGTVKLHGANFSVVFDTKTEEVVYQSRNRVITKEDKFFDFQSVVNSLIDTTSHGKKTIEDFLKFSISTFLKFEGNLHLDNIDKFILFGELVGEGVQKDVAVDYLQQRFVIFDLAYTVNDELFFLDYNFLIDFSTFLRNLAGEDNKDYLANKVSCIIDYGFTVKTLNVFIKSELLATQNELSIITAQIEKECPFAKHFGVCGVGEGMVWRSMGLPHNPLNGFGIRFKVKGDEHTNSKVRTLNTVEQGKIEAVKDLEEVVEIICTKARLEQGEHYLIANNTPVSDYRKVFKAWIIEDTLKEESDFIVEKGFNIEDVKKKLAVLADSYYKFTIKPKIV